MDNSPNDAVELLLKGAVQEDEAAVAERQQALRQNHVCGALHNFAKLGLQRPAQSATLHTYYCHLTRVTVAWNSTARR